jgi:hypothetical protein
MAVIKLVEDYAVRQLRNDVRDSLMMTGEQSILLQLFHPGDKDAVPCPECGDDVYESAEKACTTCFGTMWDGGVRAAMKVWALYTDHQIAEQLGKRGTYEPDQRSVQFEAFPMVAEHDVLVRVPAWDSEGKPLQVEGFYLLQAVTRRSLRTGTRAGQYGWDVVAQKAQVAELPQRMHGITTYPILGQVFEESVVLKAQTPTVPASAVLQPDVRVVYFPFEATPSGEVPSTPSTPSSAGMVYTQTTPAATWTIAHTLGYEPNVSIIVGGEEVEAEVDYPNNSLVVITFGVPVAGTARLT